MESITIEFIAFFYLKSKKNLAKSKKGLDNSNINIPKVEAYYVEF